MAGRAQKTHAREVGPRAANGGPWSLTHVVPRYLLDVGTNVMVIVHGFSGATESLNNVGSNLGFKQSRLTAPARSAYYQPVTF